MDDNFEPDWVRYAFTTMLTCDDEACGAIVTVSGWGSEEIEYDEDEDGIPRQNWATELYPVSMYPAPHLFPMSDKFPEAVAKELKLAFQLFWTDLSTSTSRLRTSLERVLDERGIPSTKLGKQGKEVRLPLAQRIDLFEANFNDADSAESMNALRAVGNLGTHGDPVQLNDYLNLLDVYEDALLEIYTQAKAAMKKKKLDLIALGKKA